ncbi:transposase [Bacillus sp. MKU004]|nr:transposase [Bacillus sp. MKU004]
MPRQARKKSKSGVYHIMLRGINRQTIFEDEEDKARFLYILFKCVQKSNSNLYAYCLMDNHVHLLLQETKEPISSVIKRLSSSYVLWYNNKYNRCGHLFQERFKSENVETAEYFRTVLRYIHQNPLKAGLSTDVFKCKWTSIHEYSNPDSTLNITASLQLFSNDQTQAHIQFNDYMSKDADDTCMDEAPKVKKTDDEVRGYLKRIGIPNVSQLQQMDKEKRDVILLELKSLNGISERQLSRVTGISRPVIRGIKKN